MRRKPRAKRPIEKGKPTGYDSKWEKTLHDTVLQDWVHHDGTVPYVIEHNYHPDFTKRIGTLVAALFHACLFLISSLTTSLSC